MPEHDLKKTAFSRAPSADAGPWRDDRAQAINKTATLLVITFDSQIANLAAGDEPVDGTESTPARPRPN
jgi:hypothetical protein